MALDDDDDEEVGLTSESRSSPSGPRSILQYVARNADVARGQRSAGTKPQFVPLSLSLSLSLLLELETSFISLSDPSLDIFCLYVDFFPRWKNLFLPLELT